MAVELDRGYQWEMLTVSYAAEGTASRKRAGA